MDSTICALIFTPCFFLLTAYLILINENQHNQEADFTTVQQHFPNVTPSVWQARCKWSVHLTVNKLRRYLVSSAEIQARGECSLLSVAGPLQSIRAVSCVSLYRCLLKNTWWYCLRKTQAHPPWGCQCLDIIHVSFAVSAALIVYQESVTQSTVWGSVPVQKMGEEVSTNCAVNAIIYGLHIERHQGHQQERVVCFAMLWAAFQHISKGSVGNAL